MRLVLLALLTGCTTVQSDPCRQVGDPILELARGDHSFDEPITALSYGIPPQGGAPYTPLRARVDGLDVQGQYVHFQMTAVDPTDGTDLGGVDYDVRLVCANVGESAGTWVLSDLHFRYFDWSMDELEGRSAEITVVATDADGVEVESKAKGPLQRI